MSRRAAVAAVSLVVLTVLLPVLMGATMPATAAAAQSAAQQNNSTATEWSAPGPYSIKDLRSGGTHPSSAPPSVRYVGAQDNPDGAVALRYRPTNPLVNNPEYMQPGTTLNGDELEIYSTLFGAGEGEYELVLVYWQQETARVNGTTVAYAANQSVQRAQINIESGYDSNTVELQSHYDDTWRVTAWLEQDGERVPGAQWTFKHASLPASQQVQIETRGEAWWYAFRTAILPGAAGIVIGLVGARGTLRRTGRGPGYTLGSWIFMGLIALLCVLGGLYYEVAAVIAHLEILMGLSLLPVAYGGGLRMHPSTENIEFVRKELTDAKAIRRSDDESQNTSNEGSAFTDGGTVTAEPDSLQGTGQDVVEIAQDGYQDELYEDCPSVKTVRGEDGTRRVVTDGIRPFLARLFAGSPRLDLTRLKTRIRVRDGPRAEKVLVDPDTEPAVEYRRPRLMRRMPVWHRLPEPEEGEKLSIVTRALYGGLTLAAFSLPYLGWKFGGQMLNAPIIGMTVGAVALAVEAYRAVDGSIDFEPAPQHFRTAATSLTIYQTEYADARTLEDTQEELWNARMTTQQDVLEHERRRDDTMAQRNVERAMGFDTGAEVDRKASKRNGHAPEEDDE